MALAPRKKYLLFSMVFCLLLLAATIIGVEFATQQFFGLRWASINLVGNPDHRMTREQFDDVNADGIRSPRDAGDFREEDFNIIVLGDSFVYGMNLGYRNALPFYLEAIAHQAGLPQVRVVNFGWISASPYLSLRLLRDIGHQYKPDLVVEVVDMTDFWDDTFYRRSVERRGFFAIAHWIPATSLVLGKWGREVIRSDWYSLSLWGVPWQRYFAMERPLEQTRPYLDVVITHLDETHRYAREQLQVPFVAFVLPRSVQYSATETPDDTSNEYTRLGPYSLEPFRYVAEVAPQQQYPLIPLLEEFRHSTVHPLTFEHDPHHTAEGNREAARFIWQHLQQRQLLPPAGTTSR